jgi:hypothetical protein
MSRGALSHARAAGRISPQIRPGANPFSENALTRNSAGGLDGWESKNGDNLAPEPLTGKWLQEIMIGPASLAAVTTASLECAVSMMNGMLCSSGFRTDQLQKHLPDHGLHVPIRNHKAIAPIVQPNERSDAVKDMVEVSKADQHQQIAHDLPGGPAVIDHQDRHCWIDGHFSLQQSVMCRLRSPRWIVKMHDVTFS